jgi:hypothetical protein
MRDEPRRKRRHTESSVDRNEKENNTTMSLKEMIHHATSIQDRYREMVAYEEQQKELIALQKKYDRLDEECRELCAKIHSEKDKEVIEQDKELWRDFSLKFSEVYKKDFTEMIQETIPEMISGCLAIELSNKTIEKFLVNKKLDLDNVPLKEIHMLLKSL